MTNANRRPHAPLTFVGRVGTNDSRLLVVSSNYVPSDEQFIEILIQCADPEIEAQYAKLIAAAPKLLVALQQTVIALNTAKNFAVPSLDTTSYKILDVCDAAISKALEAAA